MRKRLLGKTGIYVSEIGFGGEWLERHPEEESIALMQYANTQGINIIDCWMPDPKSRDIIGKAMLGNRENWYVQGHLGSTWQNGQYVRTRDMQFVKPAFEDLLARLQTDYVDFGMRFLEAYNYPNQAACKIARMIFAPNADEDEGAPANGTF